LVETIFITTAVLLRIVSNPLANVFQKQLTGVGYHPLVVNFFTYLILAFVSCFFALNFNWAKLPSGFWLYSILGGITGAIGNGFLVKALEKGDLSVLGPINSYKSVVGILVGLFLLREVPGFTGVLGIALIVYGSYFVLDTTEERFSVALLRRPEIQFRIWAMILTAIEAVFIKKLVLMSNPTVSFISWCWFGVVFSFLFLFWFRGSTAFDVKKIAVSHISRYLMLVFCIGVMQLTTNYVFDYMPVGYALSLFQLSIIVSIFLGYRIFKEVDIRKKLVGSFIMILGSVVIILSK
jgi:drug/metabolite transporter (DMT)-like permease